jgi:hypothetical protein
LLIEETQPNLALLIKAIEIWRHLFCLSSILILKNKDGRDAGKKKILL